IEGDRHAAGRLAAELALAPLGGTLAYAGTRPVVVGTDASVSITHGRTRALAVAARNARIGMQLVDDADDARLARLADRYLHAERALATTPRARAACFAAKEAGLKALGLGLLDGGMFDDCRVRVVSLDPPTLADGLSLVVGRSGDATIAVAFQS
ncbi:MAG: 4'-phosphopantetheinyl transferase superfamily protein, partial [Acidobacteriota bacterium]